jgi:hypothetical protein
MVKENRGFSTNQIILIALIIALDFAFGMIAKNVLNPTGILQVVRIDMFIPIMLLVLTRLIIDKFGTLILYELTWGFLAVAAMPGAFGLPGLLKLIPAIVMGISLDFIFTLFKRMPVFRIFLAVIIAPILSTASIFGIKVLLGYPIADITLTLLVIESISSTMVNVLGAYAAYLVWKRIKELQLVKRLQFTN